MTAPIISFRQKPSPLDKRYRMADTGMLET